MPGCSRKSECFVRKFGYNVIAHKIRGGTAVLCNFCLEGDSLVPVWSATLGDNQPLRTIYAKEMDHMDLVNNDECLEYISQLISGNSSLTGFSRLAQEMDLSIL